MSLAGRPGLRVGEALLCPADRVADALRDNSWTTRTTAGQQRDNPDHSETTRTFSILLYAYSNFNICSTLRASGQPLTPVSIPSGQDAAGDHAARGGPFPPDGPAPQDTGTKAQIRKGFLVHALDDGPLRPSSPPISRMLMCQCTVRRAAHSITIVRDETSVWQFQNVVEGNWPNGRTTFEQKKTTSSLLSVAMLKGRGQAP